MPVITVRIKYHKVFIILSHSAAGGVAVGLTWWRLLGSVPVLLLY